MRAGLIRQAVQSRTARCVAAVAVSIGGFGAGVPRGAAGGPVGVPSTQCQLVSLGNNAQGFFGNGTNINYEPGIHQYQLPAGEVIDSLWPGGAVLTTSGKLYVSGTNSSGQLGQGDTNSYFIPVEFPMPPGEIPVSVIRTRDTTVVQTAAGHLVVAGTNWTGQLGLGVAPDALVPTLVPLPAGETVVEVQVAHRNGSGTLGTASVNLTMSTWIRTASGKLYVTGDFGGMLSDTWVEVPVGYLDPSSTFVPRAVTAMVIGGASTYGSAYIVDEDGRLYAMGDNTSGKLGLGLNHPALVTTTPQSSPLPILPDGVSVATVRPGTLLSRALTTDGRVFSWGNAGAGNPLNGIPTEMPLPAGVTAQAIFGDAGPLLTTSGELYALTGLTTATQVAIPAGEAVDRVFAVSGTLPGFLVLMQSGEVYGYGYNNLGQLGIGSATTPVTSLTRVGLPAGTVVVDVAFSSVTAYFLTDAGEVWGSGSGTYANFGPGHDDGTFFTNDSVLTPVQLPLPAGLEFAAGMLADIAVKHDATQASSPVASSISLVVCPPMGSLELVKTVEGDGDRPAAGWTVSITSSNCPLPTEGTSVVLPADGGVVRFDHLQVATSSGEPCSYVLGEATFEGWTSVFTPTGPYEVAKGAPVPVALLNSSPTTTTTTTTTTVAEVTTTTAAEEATTTTAAPSLPTTTEDASGALVMPPELPATGTDTDLWMLGAALVLGGGAALAVRRRVGV